MSATPSSTSSGTLDDEARARIPKAARAHTAKGAEAFARFYLEQVNKAWMAPDPELIRPYALESCKTCANYIATSEWLVHERAQYDGVPASLGASVVLPESSLDRMLVRVVETQEARKILKRDGGVADSVPKSSGELEVEVRWTKDAWRVRAVRGVDA